jgi:hypothetical protein
VASKEGKFRGYVKPIMKDLDVLGAEDRDDNLFQKMWEGLVGGAGQVLKNQPEDQVATKIPFEGDLSKPDADVWTTVVNVLQNAFVHAIQPSIDHEINIASIKNNEKDEKKGLLKRLFTGDDEKGKDNKNVDEKKSDDKKEARERKHDEKKKARKERREKRKGKSIASN